MISAHSIRHRNGVEYYSASLRLSRVSGGEDEGGERILEGIASDGAEDHAGERVVQAGISVTPLMDEGWINWDHDPGPENLLGWPRTAKPTADGLFFRGALWPASANHARADAAWQVAQACNKTKGTRSLRWSIEGTVDERDALDRSIIRRSTVYLMALTHLPMNNRTAAIAKARQLMLAAFDGRGDRDTEAAARALDLDSTNLDQVLANTLWGECSDPHEPCCDGRYLYRGGWRGMLRHLVRCRGLEARAAGALIKALHVNLAGPGGSVASA